MIRALFFLLFVITPLSLLAGKCPHKIVICGVGKNVGFAAPMIIKHIEELGKEFEDYRVVIFENNSTDKTASLYSAWAKRNGHVTFLSESWSGEKTPHTRTSRIAKARNIIMDHVAESHYENYDLLLWVDLDFIFPWPIKAILSSANWEAEWDCISANGCSKDQSYFDRYAFRSDTYPFGPELLGQNSWIAELEYNSFELGVNAPYLPVYSAFGGMALYKTKSILPFRYSGKVNDDVKKYYRLIIAKLTPSNHQLKTYLQNNNLSFPTLPDHIPLVFPMLDCCEHLPLHAAMALAGYGKFFVNPLMVMQY